MKGWLTDDEVDQKTKKLIATPDFIREHKLKAVPAEKGHRFVDENNKAFVSPQKTETCAYFNNRFCKAVELPIGSSMLDAPIGKELRIKVVTHDYLNKKTGEIEKKSEVTDFVLATEQFKTHEVTAKEEVKAVEAPQELAWS